MLTKKARNTRRAPRVLLDLLSLGVPLLQGMTGRYNLDEIERNLQRRFPQLLDVYQEYLPRLHLEVIPVPRFKDIKALLNKMSAKDTSVLASVKNSRADYLITGDKKGFPSRVAAPIIVLAPDRFLNDVLPRIIDPR